MLQIVAYGALLPALWAAAWWVATQMPWKKTGPIRAWGGAIAVGGAYLVGFLLITGAPRLIPRDSTNWLFHIAIGATVVGLLRSLIRIPGWARWISCAAVAAIGAWLILRPQIENAAWSLAQAVCLVSLLGLTATIIVECLDWLSAQRTGGSIPAALLLIAAGVGGALVLAGTARIAQATGAVAAAMAVAAVLGWWRPTLSPALGAMPIVVMVLGGSLLCGVYYAETLPIPAAVILFLSPLAIGLAEIMDMKRLKPRTAAVLLCVMVLIPVMAGVGLTWRAAARVAAEVDPEGSPGEDGWYE